MAVADGVAGNAPAHGVGVRQPAEEGGQFSLLARPDDEMPVIGHDAPGEDSDGMPLLRFGQHSFEGKKILILREELHPADGSVPHMENKSAGSVSAIRGMPAMINREAVKSQY